MSAATARRWPVADLADAGRRPVVDVATAAGLAKRTGFRWQRQLDAGGEVLVDDFTADRAAIRFGLHPAMIWTDWIDVRLN